jgi:hypothetical protein
VRGDPRALLTIDDIVSIGWTLTHRRSRSSLGVVQFSRDLRDAVAAGRITVSFRLWRRPQVKVAGRYAVGSAWIEIDSIEVMPFSAITAEDVDQSGERNRESLRERAAHSGPISDDTLLYRVAFHLVDGTADG